MSEGKGWFRYNLGAWSDKDMHLFIQRKVSSFSSPPSVPLLFVLRQEKGLMWWVPWGWKNLTDKLDWLTFS